MSMSTEVLEWVGAIFALLGFMLALLTVRGLIAERDAWKGAADGLALCVKIDAWPLVPNEWESVAVAATDDPRVFRGESHRAESRLATVVIPPSVAVVGRAAALDRWAQQAAEALSRYDLLVDPECGR
jgi:RES domain-containing protein